MIKSIIDDSATGSHCKTQILTIGLNQDDPITNLNDSAYVEHGTLIWLRTRRNEYLATVRIRTYGHPNLPSGKTRWHPVLLEISNGILLSKELNCKSIFIKNLVKNSWLELATKYP